MTFSVPMSNFRTFQVLQNEKSNFMTFQDQWEPWFDVRSKRHWWLQAAEYITDTHSHNVILWSNTHTLQQKMQRTSSATQQHHAEAVRALHEWTAALNCIAAATYINSQYSIIDKKPSCCWESADRMALSGTAMQHADNGYSRRGNFGDSLVRNVVLIYLPHGTNSCVQEVGVWWDMVGVWLKVAKSCSDGELHEHLFRHFCSSMYMYRLATMHSITDWQTTSCQ